MGILESNTSKAKKIYSDHLGKNNFQACMEKMDNVKNYEEFKTKVAPRIAIPKGKTDWLMNGGDFLFKQGGIIDLLNKSLLSSSKGHFSTATKALQKLINDRKNQEQSLTHEDYFTSISALKNYAKKERGFIKKRMMSDIDKLKLFTAYYIACTMESIQESDKNAPKKNISPYPEDHKKATNSKTPPPLPTAPKPQIPKKASVKRPLPPTPIKHEDSFQDVPPPTPKRPVKTPEQEAMRNYLWGEDKGLEIPSPIPESKQFKASSTPSNTSEQKVEKEQNRKRNFTAADLQRKSQSLKRASDRKLADKPESDEDKLKQAMRKRRQSISPEE